MSIVFILRGILLLLRPLPPINAEEFDWVRSSDRPAPATEIVGRTVLVTAPADSFRVFGMNGNACHTKPPVEFRAGAPFRLRWIRGPMGRGRRRPGGRVLCLRWRCAGDRAAPVRPERL